MTTIPDGPILAIDTATMSLRLGLRFGTDRLVKSEEAVERTHGQILLRKIDHLLETADTEREKLTAVMVTTGPGSFTGLRIGLAAAKGIAEGLTIPIVGVSLFEIAAYLLRSTNRPFTILAPFKKDAFVGSRMGADASLSDKIEVVKNSRDDLLALFRLGAVSAIGLTEGLLALPPELAGGIRRLQYDAADLLTVGTEKLVRNETDDVLTLEPLYAQPSQAELRFVETHRKK